MLGLPSKCAHALRTAAVACQGPSKQGYARRLISTNSCDPHSATSTLFCSSSFSTGKHVAQRSLLHASKGASRRPNPLVCQCMRYLTDSASAPSSLHSPPAAITSTDPRSLQPSQSRIESLPLWNDPLMPLEGQSPVSDDHGPSLLHSILGVADVTPVHPTLRHLQSKGVHFYSRHDNNDNNSKGTRLPRNQALQTVMDVLIDPTAELEFSDYAYVLAIIDQAVSSQQQFWTILSHFVRRTITKESEDTKFWKVRLGKYVIPVYRSQDRSIFLQQLARLDGEVKEACKEKDDGSHEEGGEEGRRKPLLTDQYILGKLMVESLVYPATDDKEAALLFDALNVHGQIRFHKDVFGTLVKRATLMHSAPQISLLGEIMLRHEALFAQNKVPSRPLLIHRTYMDNYLLKACELGFETLARDVFQASLAAGRCHRTSSFNIILNSYSTKQFGPVSFASTAQLRQQRRRQQRQDIDPHRSTSKRSGDNDSGNFNTLQERLAALRVGKFGRSMLTTHLEPVDKLVREMEQFGVVPDMGTLNILVKLYLEVDLQGIHESRHWQEVFTRYNPADLEPDTVTCNTLLAYYERKRDLVMMRTIYESMTTAEEVGSVVKTRRQRRKEARESDQQPEQPLPKKEEDVLVKSQRDVFTYNTMLYALLRHAKDPTDMAAIGQVFYDMEQDGIPADTVTFNTNIMFHIRRGDFVAAMQVYQDMYEQPAVKDKEETLVRDHPTRRRRTIQKSLPTWTRQPSSTALSTEPLDNTPSDSLSNLSIPKSLSRAFTPTPPTRDSITYTSLMSGYGQSNQMEIATFFFSEMVRLGLEPNFKTYSTLVAGLERAGDFQRAQTLWDMVLKEGKLTPKERKLVEALCLSSKQS